MCPLSVHASKHAAEFRTFLRDGAYFTDPVLKDGAAVYTPGVSERRGTATTYLHSGLKNADAQSSALGALTATRQYDAFGNVASSTGTWQGPFGYAGGFGYQEDATGLRLLGHRLYDASTGRFLTRDPIRDGRNWYVYCGNDPVNAADPTGLVPWGGIWKGYVERPVHSVDHIVIVIGDSGKGHWWGQLLLPGQTSDPNRDADYVVVIDPKTGKVRVWKLGANVLGAATAVITQDPRNPVRFVRRPLNNTPTPAFTLELIPGAKRLPNQMIFEEVIDRIPKSIGGGGARS